MKKTTMLRISTILASALLTSTMAWAATDYSAMTTEELAAKRGSMKQSTMEERNAFQNEWRNRVQKMTQEEKQKFMGQPENAPRDGSGQKNGQDQGKGNGQRLQDGSGSDSMNQGGGMSSGSGMSGGMGRGGMGGGRR